MGIPNKLVALHALAFLSMSRGLSFAQQPRVEYLHVDGESFTQCSTLSRVGGETLAITGPIAPRPGDDTTTGEQRIAVLLVKSPGIQTPNIPVESISDVFFSPSSPSVSSYLNDNSEGKSFASGSVFGWLTLDADYNCDQTAQMQDAAFRAAELFVDLSTYNRIFIVFPTPLAGCSFGAIGQMAPVSHHSALRGDFTASTYWLRAESLANREWAVWLVLHQLAPELSPAASSRGGFHTEHIAKTNAASPASAVNSPPAVVSANPASGVAPAQFFTFKYSDPDGYADLVWARANFSTSAGAASACVLEYNRPGNTIRLGNDAGTDFSSLVPLNQANTLQNSQCRVFFVSAYASSSKELTLNVILVFKSAFAGNKTVFLNAEDSAAQTTGWVAMASWTVTSNQPPAPVSVSPGSGAGTSQIFSFLYSDGNGYADIYSVDVLINANLNTSGGCYLIMYPNDNLLYLQSDNADFLGPLTIGQAGSLQNSRCKVDGSLSSVSTAGNMMRIDVAFTFYAPFAGAKDISTKVDDYSGANAGRQILGAWRVAFGADQPPSPFSASPSAGSGTSQTFSFVYSDPDGFADISSASVLINSGLDGRNACYLIFDRLSNSAYLVNDASNGSTRLDLGGAGSLQNSQCVLDAIGSSASGFGTDLTLRLVLTFKPAFAGPKNLYMNAQDFGGISSGLQSRGSWTVVNIGNQAPTDVSVTPNSGTGSGQTFSFVFSDANGYTDIASTTVLISSALDGRNACFVYYDRPSNALFLINDASNGSTRVNPGASMSAQNSQCTLNGAGSSGVGSATNLTLNLALTFKPAFTGPKSIYMSAQDLSGLNTGLPVRGTWTVMFGASEPPSAVSVSPGSGGGLTQTFSFAFSDQNGYIDITSTTILINSTLDGKSGCVVYYDRASNAAYLINDASTGSSRVDLGTLASAQNSQCTLNGSGSSAAASGNNLTLNLALTFKAAFAGAKTIYMNAQDSTALSSGLQARGSWTVSSGNNNLAPSAISASPGSGSGSSQTFSFIYSDPNGFADLAYATALINSTLDGRNACFLSYDRFGTALYLINDASTGSTRIDPGSSMVAQNSQCAISGAGSTVTVSGNSLTLTVAITFKPAFTGAKVIYMNVQDSGGLSSGLQARGNWMVP